MTLLANNLIERGQLLMGLNISVKLVLEFQSKDALDLEKKKKKKNSAEQHKPCSIAEYKSKICFKIK